MNNVKLATIASIIKSHRDGELALGSGNFIALHAADKIENIAVDIAKFLSANDDSFSAGEFLAACGIGISSLLL